MQRLLAFLRSYPFVIVCSVLTLGFGSASYYLWQNQATVSTKRDTERRRGEDMLLSLSGLTRVSSELNAVKEALEFIEQNLIREGDLAENLGYFYQLETVSRVKMQNLGQLSAQPAPEGVAYKAVPFNVRASGTYRQVMRLVRELETGPRLCRIQTYTLTGGGGGAPDGQIQIDLSLEMLAHP